MDNTRLFLFIALSFIGLMLWDAWQRDYATPPPAPQIADSDTQQASDNPQNLQQDAQPPVIVDDEAQAKNVQDPTNINLASVIDSESSSKFVSVETDLYSLKIDLQGGGVSYAALNEYPQESSDPDTPFVFLDNSQQRLFIHQNGLTGTGATPDHRAQYTSAKNIYTLAEGENDLTVNLSWAGDNGLAVVKQYTFHRDKYTIDISYTVTNKTGDVWQGRLYEQLQRAKPASTRRLLYTFTGAAVSTPEDLYNKYDYDDLKDTPLNVDVTNGWMAVIEHYFVTALLPIPEQKYHYYSKVLDERRYIVGMYSRSFRDRERTTRWSDF